MNVLLDTAYITYRKEKHERLNIQNEEGLNTGMDTSYGRRRHKADCSSRSICVVELFGFGGGYGHKNIFSSEKYKSSVKLQNFHPE